MEYNTELTITMETNDLAQKALSAACATLEDLAWVYNQGYCNDPTGRFVNALSTQNNTIVLDENGYFIPEDLQEVIETILEAIAKALPTSCFTCSSYTTSTYAECGFEASYDGKVISSEYVYYPEGYISDAEIEDLDISELDIEPKTVERKTIAIN